MITVSTGYESEGRTAQKQRTRSALVEAARRLLADGTVPTVEGAAALAGISRPTAYRYFSSQGALLLAAHPELTPSSLLEEPAPPRAEQRVDAVVDRLGRMTVEGESQLRAVLRLSLAPDADRGELSLRRGRAIAWIEEALSVPDSPLTAAERHRLAIAIRSAVGIESLVWLVDVAGLDRAEAVALQRWSAQALLRAALADPPPRRRSCYRRSRGARGRDR
jgi:AcrR family transcriptional regulator